MSKHFVLPEEWVRVCTLFRGQQIFAKKIEGKFKPFYNIMLIEYDSTGTSTLFLKVTRPDNPGDAPLVTGRLLISDPNSEPFVADSFGFHDVRKATKLIHDHFDVEIPSEREVTLMHNALQSAGGGILMSGWEYKDVPNLPKFINQSTSNLAYPKNQVRVSGGVVPYRPLRNVEVQG